MTERLQASERTAPTKSDRGARSHNATVDNRRLAGRKHNNELVRCCRSCLASCRIQQRNRRSVVKAASELAQYFLPKKPTQKKSRRGNFAPDQYGFVVDPDLARELRDTQIGASLLAAFKQESSRPYAVAQKASKLQARIKEIQRIAAVPVPVKIQIEGLH